MFTSFPILMMKDEGGRTLAMAGIGPGFQHRSRFDGYVMGVVIGVEAKAILFPIIFTGAVTKFLEPGADTLSLSASSICLLCTNWSMSS